MTRHFWMAISLLAAAAAAWLYLGFGPDNLLWAWSRLMAPAAALPPAVPATRLADALLAAILVAYLAGFVPLAIATWLQGTHLTSLARAAAAAAEAGADEVSTARIAMLRAEAERSSPWQLLLQFDLVDISEDTDPPHRRASIERAAIVSDLVTHQSAATLFRGLAWICLCLGVFALVAQTISNLLGTDLLQRPARGLELAATRGLLSAATAVIVAGFIDLCSRVANAAIRQRAETLGRRFERLRRARRQSRDWDDEPTLSAEPIPPLSVRRVSDRMDLRDQSAAILERSEQQIAERIDGALQSLTGNTLRPMLQDVSRVLSALNSQANSMVETIDRRLAEQRDDARTIAETASAAREEVVKQTAEMLERSQQQLANSVDGALHSLADTSIRPVLQEVSGLLGALTSQAETIADTLDRRLAQQREDARQIAEAADAARTELAKQTAILLERSQRQIAERVDEALQSLTGTTVRPMLQELSRLLEILTSQAAALVGTLDSRLSEQRDDSRQFAETAAAGNRQLASLLDELHQAMGRSTAVLEQRLDRLIESQQTLQESIRAARPNGPAASSSGGDPAANSFAASTSRPGQDALALLSRFLAEATNDPMPFVSSVPTRNGHRGPQDWTGRLDELRRSTADLTRELPALHPNGSK